MLDEFLLTESQPGDFAPTAQIRGRPFFGLDRFPKQIYCHTRQQKTGGRR